MSPDDPDHVLIANSTLWRSRDGGKIWQSGGGGCGDCHDIWWDVTPTMPATTSSPATAAWAFTGRRSIPTGNTSVSLPIGQMYRVTVDQRQPVLGLRQSSGRRQHADHERAADRAGERPPRTRRPRRCGTPRSRRGGGGWRRRGRWTGAGGGARKAVAAAVAEDAAVARRRPAQESMPSCESGYTYPEPNNHRVRVGHVLCGARRDVRRARAGQRRSVSPWMHTLDTIRSD